MERDQSETLGVKIIAIILIAAMLFGCRGSQPRAVPQELLGLWGTSDPLYQGCTFEITDRMIIFENDADYVHMNWIQETEKLTRAGTVLFRIRYADREKLASTTSLLYAKTDRGDVLRFANLNQVEWTRIGRPSM